MRRLSVTAQLFVWQLVLLLAVFATLALVLDHVLEQRFLDDLTRSMISQARTVQAALPADDRSLEETVRGLGGAGDLRITVIRTDGTVLADSEHDPATMENHSTRPEVEQALGGSPGTASRMSATLGIPFRYVALPPSDGRIVRVALPLTQVRSRQGTVRVAIVIGFLLAAVGVSLGTLIVSRRVTRSLRRTTESVEQLGRGETAPVIESGPKEVATLAATVNRMASDLRQQMDEVADARRLQDLILSSMEEGILLSDANGGIVFGNDAAEALLGRLPGGIGTLPPVLRAAVTEAKKSGVPVSVETDLGAPARTLRGLASAVGSDGSVLLVLRDVTEAKRLDAVRRDFVTNASHELKTPAAAIQAIAETIRRATTSDPEVIPRFAEQLEHEAIRLSRIVSDLLDLSRLESGSDLESDVRMDDIALEESARFRAAAEEAGLTLEVDVGPTERVRGSARDLSLLVRNLVDNAIRWTHSGGSVRVSVGSVDGETRLEVADTGIGIPSRDLTRIFERFYRVDRARSRDTGGTGLGLSIVRHVAENHGGSVRVESELGRGTTFQVSLPAVHADADGAPTEDPVR
jgi:two-component system, OmpR family, phosphate regulon sensor histidine kinase PhoR